MDVSILPLQKIFALDVQFRVPLYQRPYVWDRDRQWMPLWEDVTSLAEGYLDDGTHISHHFLGAVVVRQRPNPVGTLEVRDVIDGQQRLTTLQLLADAVEEVIREQEGPVRESKKLRKLVLNDIDLFTEDEQFKIWPTNADQPVFRHAMTDEKSVPEDLVDKPIAKAHAYFKSQARDWALEPDSAHTVEERFGALVMAISHGVHLVVIDLEEDDNAQAIFETLNARGTPLLASDLVKNHMLHEAQAQALDVEELHRDHWRDLEADWWREEITLGRVRWPRLDAFLFYWLSMNFAREVSTQRLFDEYRKFVSDGQLAVLDVADNLSRFSGVFEELESGSFDGLRLAEFFYRWEVSQLRVMTPLLLWLFSDDAEISDRDRVQSLELLESWFMRRMICGRTTRGYQNFLHPLLREVKKHSGGGVPAAISATLSQAEAQNTAWPTDGDVRESVRSRPLYLQLSRARLRMVLEAIEDRLSSSDGKSELLCPKDLTIEHLLPVGWSEEDWPLQGSELSRDERWIRLHTLGNLTLANDKLNPAMSNSAWTLKRSELGKHSNLHLNKMLSNRDAVPDGHQWFDTWDDNTIVERSDWLAEQICTIWKRTD
ncbi:MAG: DUF262 domain-containing protein [Acidimicrobiaceae bacterium]|nr:DUF262 domain-containing protein [Acidimicrobiaceae bacterium]